MLGPHTQGLTLRVDAVEGEEGKDDPDFPFLVLTAQTCLLTLTSQKDPQRPLACPSLHLFPSQMKETEAQRDIGALRRKTCKKMVTTQWGKEL